MKVYHIFWKCGRKTTPLPKKVVEYLPLEPQKDTGILQQPKNVVEKRTLMACEMVENLSPVDFFLWKSRQVVEIEAAFGKTWFKIDHFYMTAVSTYAAHTLSHKMQPRE